MTPISFTSPGVYIEETNAFPNSVVPVPTAVPAFIGYTPQASYEEDSYHNVPVMVRSMNDFRAIFCWADPPPPMDPIKQYKPEYYLVKQKSQPEKGDYILIGTDYYSIVPDPYTIYYLYNSVKIFFENGGECALIVSVGTYGPPSKSPMTPGDQMINPNVQLNELLEGLELLKKEQSATMYICPEATLLSIENNGTLMQSMLLQASELGTAVCIFDVIGGNDPDPILYTDDISTFRNNTGVVGLKYGTAYYPFIGTTIMQQSDIDYNNLFGGDVAQLEPILNPSSDPNPKAASILSNIKRPSGPPLSVSQQNNALHIASKTYGNIIKHVLKQANMLPPSGAMAGVITTVDNNMGVWQAPANTSMIGVYSLPINLSDSQQGNLNVDAISGKSINAIRSFSGRGILIWGARTLAGNDNEWRYLSVRRTMTFLEQSCKRATEAFIFEPNNEATWLKVKSMISSFLTSIWKDGGLQGAKPDNAFSVECGLGTTMTSEDILSGYMRVSVSVAIVRPAEFIVFTFQQKMPSS